MNRKQKKKRMKKLLLSNGWSWSHPPVDIRRKQFSATRMANRTSAEADGIWAAYESWGPRYRGVGMSYVDRFCMYGGISGFRGRRTK